MRFGVLYGEKYLKNYLLLLLSLPIIGTTVAFCTNYLLNNKNTSNVNSSTTNSLDVITPTCSLGTCDANTLKLTGSTYDARNIINNEWVFENIKHLLSGNVNLIVNSSDISEIETIIEPKNNLKNNNLTLKFIVATGKTYDTNGLPTTSPTPFVVTINGFTPPSQTIAKASLTANDLGFNDQTVYDARSAIQNKGKTWVFENLNKLLDGNLDSTISVNDISDISVSKDNIGSNKRNDTLELSFFIKEGKTFDTNGYISNKKTLFKTTITNFSINPRTITNISCEASSLGFDSKTTYEAKKEINNSAEWIFNHKETIFNHDQKLLNKINVEDISNVNVEIKNSGNNIQNNSITINFNIAKDRTYDENGYLNTNSVPFSINVTNFKISEKTTFESICDANSIGISEYNVGQVKALLSPYFILQHKEKLIKGDNEIKLQTDIKKIDVVFDQNNNVNQRISDKSTIEENTISNNITSILLRVIVGAQKAYDENGFLINNDKTFETKITNLKPCDKEVYEKDKKDFDEEVKKSGFVNFSNVSTKENSPIVIQSSKTNSNNDEELHKQAIIKYLQEQYKYTGDDTINKSEGNSNKYCVTVSSKTNWRCSKVFGKDWKKIIEPLTNLYLKNNDKDDNGNEKDNVRQIVFRFELIKTETNTYNNIVTYELKPKSIQFFWSEDAKRPYWLSTSSEDSIKVDISGEYKVNNSNHTDSNRILLMVQTKN